MTENELSTMFFVTRPTNQLRQTLRLVRTDSDSSTGRLQTYFETNYDLYMN